MEHLAFCLFGGRYFVVLEFKLDHRHARRNRNWLLAVETFDAAIAIIFFILSHWTSPLEKGFRGNEMLHPFENRVQFDG